MLSLLPSLIVLGSLAAIALFVVTARPPSAANVADNYAAARALRLAIAAQCLHFVEELLFDLRTVLPSLFELPRMPISLFLTLNLAWIAIWFASIRGLKSGRKDAFFAAWFLGIAGIFNAMAHPALAVVAGGYFPGLVSAPVVGAAGVWLVARLHRATARRH